MVRLGLGVIEMAVKKGSRRVSEITTDKEVQDFVATAVCQQDGAIAFWHYTPHGIAIIPLNHDFAKFALTAMNYQPDELYAMFDQYEKNKGK